MSDQEYDALKEYEIRGVKVRSEVVRDECSSDTLTRSLVIKSSCESERWGIRTQEHSFGCGTNWPEFSKEFERTRYQAADTLVKTELGEISDKRVPFLAPEIYGPTGIRIQPLSSADLSISPTLLGMEVINLLKLVRTGGFFYQHVGGRVNRVPLFQARIKFGAYETETSIAPSEHGVPACILGGDFFQKALRGREEVISELIMPEHFRTLVNAARCKKKCVLIAGKYGEHRSRLESIKQALNSLNLVGLILDEFPDIEEQPLAEKMVTYASMCRFVIVDDLVPSGHINELDICHERKYVTAVLRLEGKPSTAMQANVGDEVAFIKEFAYGENELQDAVIEAAKWGDETVNERSRALNRRYRDWRSPNRIM
jgi:hypothetical protein